jgi:hypothetical protein
VSDDIKAARGVLERAALALTDECTADIESYMETHPRGNDGRVIYDLQGNFGVTADELGERFAFYIDAFDIRPEVR